jgi:hypothetical protein
MDGPRRAVPDSVLLNRRYGGLGSVAAAAAHPGNHTTNQRLGKTRKPIVARGSHHTTGACVNQSALLTLPHLALNPESDSSRSRHLSRRDFGGKVTSRTPERIQTPFDLIRKVPVTR